MATMGQQKESTGSEWTKGLLNQVAHFPVDASAATDGEVVRVRHHRRLATPTLPLPTLLRLGPPLAVFPDDVQS